MNKNPVVVYGANGYTGRLICEYLREYQVPFIAAGRDAGRVEEAMQYVPGIETARYEVAQVQHTLDDLVELFSGAKVVCNTVGPFARLSTLVVEAALKAGCHYLDTTGEQEWMIKMRDTYGAAYAEKGLLLVPSSAYMFAVGNIAAEFCLEQDPSIDCLDYACIPTGIPTVGSTRSVMDMVRNKQYWLEHGDLVQLDKPMKMLSEINVPGQNAVAWALPWGGGALPLWYSDDPRISNCKSVTGFNNRPLMQHIMGIAEHYHENIESLPAPEQVAALNEIADTVTPGMPPRENRNIHRTVDICHGLGNTKTVKCTIIGNSAYLQTGLIQAFIASQLLKGTPRNIGFQSPTGAVGHRQLFAALQSYGYVNMALESI